MVTNVRSNTPENERDTWRTPKSMMIKIGVGQNEN